MPKQNESMSAYGHVINKCPWETNRTILNILILVVLF